jgi:hypothetical protein
MQRLGRRKETPKGKFALSSGYSPPPGKRDGRSFSSVTLTQTRGSSTSVSVVYFLPGRIRVKRERTLSSSDEISDERGALGIVCFKMGLLSFQ